MNGSIKVLPTHLNRHAVVYLRQSDPKQVRENRESAFNQRALSERLRELTWKPEQIVVIDGDQGVSAKHAEGRDTKRLKKIHARLPEGHKRLKIRLGRPKPTVRCPWPKARKTRRLKTLRRLVAELPDDEVLVYMDEVDIHLNPKIGPDYMLPGTQKDVLTPGKNHKRYLAGSLDARSGRLCWAEGERKNSTLFLQFLWQLLREEYPDAKRIHVILDNYRVHSSRQVQLTLPNMQDRIRLHFLPPYCPDDNRIERVWRDLHANVTRNHRCRTLGQLMSEVRRWLRRRNYKLQREYDTRTAA